MNMSIRSIAQSSLSCFLSGDWRLSNRAEFTAKRTKWNCASANQAAWMPKPAFKVRPKPIQAKSAFGTYAKDMNLVSLPASKHPSEAMELVCKSNASEDTGEISFMRVATVLSVVNEYGK